MSWVFYCVLFHLIASPVKLQGTDGCDEDADTFIKGATRETNLISVTFEDGNSVSFPVQLEGKGESDATIKLNHKEKTHAYTDMSLIGTLGTTAVTTAVTTESTIAPQFRDSDEESKATPNATYVKIPGSGLRSGENQIAFIQGFFFIDGGGENPGKYTLVGFNQQWNSCPQPLCVLGTLDSAYTLDGEIYLVRGKFVWTLNAYRVADAKLFKTLNPTIPLYTDAAFVYTDEQPVKKFFSRGKSFYCETKENAKCQGYVVTQISNVLDGKDFAPELIQAATFYPGTKDVLALHYKDTNMGYLRRFKKDAQANFKFHDSSICGESMQKNRDNCFISYGLLQNGADAMFVKGNELVIIQQNAVIVGDLSKFPAETESISDWTKTFKEFKTFEYLFKCEDAIYTGTFSVDKTFFSTEFHRLFELHTPSEIEEILSSMKKGFSRATRDSLGRAKAYLPYILGVVLTLVIIVIVAIIVTERRRRIRKRLRIIRLKKRGLVDNRAGALDEIHAHRSHLDDDILMDTYTPGKKLKTVYKKVPPGKGGNLSRTGSSLSVKSTTVKSPNTLKTVGSRALDNDLALDSKQGSKIFGKGKKSTVGSRLSVKTSKR